MIKQLLKRIYLVLSSVSCWLLLSYNTQARYKIFLFCGFLFGIGFIFVEENLQKNNRTEKGLFEKISGIIFSFVICTALGMFFYSYSPAFPYSYISWVKILISIMLSFLAFPLILKIMMEFASFLHKAFDFIHKTLPCFHFQLGTEQIKASIKTLVKMFVIIGLSSIIGLILLIFVFMIPVSQMSDNVKLSAEKMKAEGLYPQLFPWCQSQLDNWTDAAIILESSDTSQENALEKALLLYSGNFEELIRRPWDAIVRHYVNEENFPYRLIYGRYWHGSLLWTKVLFCKMTFDSVRLLNGIIQLCLFIILLIQLKARGLKEYCIPCILTYCMLMPLAVSKCMNFSPCFYIAIVGSLIFVSLKKTRKNSHYIFLFLGILTSYFDILTYPVFTFGLPALMLIALQNGESLQKILADIFKNGLSWCLGYAGMWISKWILTCIFTDYNMFSDALSVLKTRVSNSSADGAIHYSLSDCLLMNISDCFFTPATFLCIIYCWFIYFRYVRKFSIQCKRFLPYFVVAMIPFIWYCCTVNHSSIHHWFTCKTCIVSVAAVMFAMTRYRTIASQIKTD